MFKDSKKKTFYVLFLNLIKNIQLKKNLNIQHVKFANVNNE